MSPDLASGALGVNAARPTVLFVAPLPPPVTGMAAVSRLVAEGLSGRFRFRLLDFSKRTLRPGISSLHQLAAGLRLLAVPLLSRSSRCVYLALSQSRLGNLRDVLVLLMTRRKRQVVHLHGGRLQSVVAREPRPLRVLNRLAFRGVDAAIALGPSLRGAYGGLVPSGRVVVVPNCAAAEVFASDAQIAAKFGTASLNVLYLANMIADKGYLELCVAVARLRAGGEDGVVLSLAGAFETERARRRAVARFGGEAAIRFCGAVGGEERVRLLHHAHVLCLPTQYAYEGQPLCILEAYAAGCYVVTSLHAGIPDVFAPGVNGSAVAARSVTDLERVLGEVATRDRAELRSTGLRNASLARRFYTEARFLRDMERILDGSS